MKTDSLWPLLAVLLLTGCALQRDSHDPSVPSTLPGRTVTTMDRTLGTYGQGREQRLVLVTLTEGDHARLRAKHPASDTREALPRQYADFIVHLQTRYGLERVADWPLPVLGIHCLVLELDGRMTREQIVVALNAEPLVESVQAMQLFSLQQQPYNDPYLHLQHGFRSLGADASHRWALGSGVTVAVIDTGVDSAHPDLAEAVSTMRNFVDQDEAAFLSDVHGTAVAGVIAAAANNATGMVGMAPAARLMALKACWQGATGVSDASCNSYTLAKALNFAIAKRSDIINLSLAGPPDPLLERLIRRALERDIVVVAADAPGGGKRFPASVAGTLAVGQLDQQRQGVLAAPGVNVLSTHPQQAYRFFTGSSFSTAHIAGLAALVRELRPGWSTSELEALLQATADPANGAVSACRAIARVRRADEAVCG